MIREKRNDAYGRQTLRVDCCGWDSYREAVSYIMHKTTVEQFGFAFECLEAVKKLPNQITPSFTLYVILKDLAETSNDFANIERFSKELGNTHVQLNIWTRAFEKAHLSRLAESKDKGVDLYKMK